MKTKHFLLLSILLLNIFNILAANSQKDSHEEEIEFTNISIREGLSESVVLASCQDKLGHMWFATQDGVNRYNGYDFTIYRNESEDSTTIADNISRTIFRDSKGRMWFGTAKGLSLYDMEADIFRNYPSHDEGVTGIAELDEGTTLLVASGGRLRIFNTDRKGWEDDKAVYLKESMGAGILLRHEGSVFVGTL